MPETIPLPVLRWPCDLARPAPHRAQIFRGETVRLEALLNLNGAPVEIPAGATATLAWQSRDMGSSWYTATASLDAQRGTVWADFGPDKDAGADEYRAFLRVDTDGACYRAVAALQILPSPGATINEIPIPPRVLDFATIEVLNAPYWTKAEADGRFASVADATLNGRGPNHDGFSEWVLSPASFEGVVLGVQYSDQAQEWLVVDVQTGDVLGQWFSPKSGSGDETSLTWTEGVDAATTLVATRTALPGYVLGNQTDKPIPKLSDVPAVVAPSTAASASGKAADAKATGDALALKATRPAAAIGGEVAYLYPGGELGASNIPIAIVATKDSNPAAPGNLVKVENDGGFRSSGIPASLLTGFSAETWEFTLDDDSTVQKQLLVAPVAAQGGA